MRIRKEEFSKYVTNQPHKPLLSLGKYLFPFDFVKANKNTLLKDLSNKKKSLTGVNELSQGKISNTNEFSPQISVLSSFGCNTSNPSRKHPEHSKPRNQAPVEENSETISVQKKKTGCVKYRHVNTKSMRSFIESPKTSTNYSLPDVVSAHRSYKKHSVLEAYSTVTHQGVIRHYNEDRVSLILNLEKPHNKTVDYWPTITFFGLYDGHGGAGCAEYLRDHLHYFVSY